MSQVVLTLEHDLELEASREEVWALLNDVPRLVTCMPGASLLETIDENSWRGQVALDLGFTRMTFEGVAHRVEADLDSGRAVIDLDGSDAKGRSTAKAILTVLVSEQGSGTRIDVVTDVDLQGDAARFGAGIVEDVSYEVVDQFSKNMGERLKEGAPVFGAKAATTTVSRLTLWGAIRMWFRGRFNRRRRRAAVSKSS